MKKGNTQHIVSMSILATTYSGNGWIVKSYSWDYKYLFASSVEMVYSDYGDRVYGRPRGHPLKPDTSTLSI